MHDALTAVRTAAAAGSSLKLIWVSILILWYCLQHLYHSFSICFVHGHHVCSISSNLLTQQSSFLLLSSHRQECLSWLDKNKQINKKIYLTLIFLHSEKAKVPFSPLLDFILVSLLPEGDLYLHISCSTINFCLIQLGQIFCWIVFMQTHLRLYCAARAACL